MAGGSPKMEEDVSNVHEEFAVLMEAYESVDGYGAKNAADSTLHGAVAAVGLRDGSSFESRGW
jgi:hypothetical protein